MPSWVQKLRLHRQAASAWVVLHNGDARLWRHWPRNSKAHRWYNDGPPLLTQYSLASVWLPTMVMQDWRHLAQLVGSSMSACLSIELCKSQFEIATDPQVCALLFSRGVHHWRVITVLDQVVPGCVGCIGCLRRV